MAEKILKTRLLLKQDTLTNWNSSTLPLKKGEVVFATASASIGSGLTEPVVMAKVCTEDGKTFSELPFSFYAKASDVYDWAKQDGIKFEKIGTGNVVSGLTFADGKIKYETASVATSEGLAAIQEKIDTNEDLWAKDTTYSFEIVDGKLKITPSSGEATELDFITPEEFAQKQDKLSFNTEYDASTNKVATMADVKNATAALSGAMHFKGIVEELPSTGTDGDVYIVGEKEYVWTGSKFEEFGNPSNYAIKGSIVNADIAENAAIEKAKLAAGVQASLGLADSAVQPAAIADMATTANVTEAISTAAKDATTKADAALSSAKTYADGLSVNYATAAQGKKADSAVQPATLLDYAKNADVLKSISAGTGLKVSAKADNSQIINIDDSVTFILDCGGAEG